VSSKWEWLSYLDLTRLEETDTAETITALCQKAVTPYGKVAAVCVYPRFVKQVTALLKEKNIKCATVLNFPQGSAAQTVVLEELRHSMEAGAEELDVVFPYQAYVAGQESTALALIQACKTAAANAALLKVIIETGALQDLALIAKVTEAVILAGADFVKTSTGKMIPGATLEASRVILATIKKVSVRLGRPVGFKAAGGIREPQQAAQYLALAKEILGASAVSPQNFRIGTSTAFG
jgi:deoxyribose-phosphate aldolase